MIEATPLGPILDRPIGEVLAGLGLPALPTLPPLPPLPGLPPLPVIDIGMLLKPMTDLLGGFGTGDLSGAGSDPSMVFDGLSTVLDTSMSMAQGACKLLDQLWTGQSSVSAAAKTTEASVNSGALSAQGSGMSMDIQVAAGIVAAGLAAVQAILLATIAKITALSVTLATPPGQGAAVAFATEGLAEATSAVALTRAQLLAPTSQMVVNGAPVPVTNAPTPASGAQSPFALAGTILDTLSPVVSAATELPSMLAAPVSQMLGTDDLDRVYAANHVAAGSGDDPPAGAGPSPAGLATSGRGGSGVGGGGVGGGGVIAAPLGASRPSVPAVGATTETASYTPATSARPGGAAISPMPASMAPMGAAGAARGGGATGEDHTVPDYLVTEDNGQEVVGDVPDVIPPVIGDNEAVPAAQPDVQLRLGPQGSANYT